MKGNLAVANKFLSSVYPVEDRCVIDSEPSETYGV